MHYLEITEKLDYFDKVIDELRWLMTRINDPEWLKTIGNCKQFYIKEKLKLLKEIGRI